MNTSITRPTRNAPTPGPWIAHTLPDGTLEILGAEALPVAVTCFYRDGTQHANAKLIAAAPALFKALDQLQSTPNDPRAHRAALDAIKLAGGEV